MVHLILASIKNGEDLEIMDWRDTIEDPQVGEMYFDGISEKMYMFKSLGDYPPEWINITPAINDRD